jgi:hypothetical protein
MPFSASSWMAARFLRDGQAHAAQHVRSLRELDVGVADDFDAVAPRIAEVQERAGHILDTGFGQRLANGLLVVDDEAEVRPSSPAAGALLQRDELIAEIDEGSSVALAAHLELEQPP